jgi:hypothetical protein
MLISLHFYENSKKIVAARLKKSLIFFGAAPKVPGPNIKSGANLKDKFNIIKQLTGIRLPVNCY